MVVRIEFVRLITLREFWQQLTLLSASSHPVQVCLRMNNEHFCTYKSVTSQSFLGTSLVLAVFTTKPSSTLQSPSQS